jgi:hypothetical protein
MAGSKSDYLENEILDHILKTAAYTQATNIYVALYTAAPTDAGGGTELSGNAYGRIVKNTWDAASGGATENTGAITFNQATGDWGTVVAFGLLDNSTGGNLLYWGDLTANKAVNSGDTAEFADGAIDIVET